MTTAAVLAALALSLGLRGPVVGTRRPPGRSRPGRTVAVLCLGAAGLGCWVLFDGLRVVLAVIVLGAAWGAWRVVARARIAQAAEERAGRVLEACDAMAADLAAGQTPLVVLERVAEEWPELGPVAAAARLDADVPASMRGVARHPGAEELRTVAAAWQVAHRSGAGLADALADTADAIRARRRTARTVATELAAARSTARMMALLPVLILALGGGLGVDPWQFLTGTPFGVGCLASGLALAYLGMAWIQRIADGVTAR
ncbi:MAG: type II secretion system F family protein [Marmoricola sp.]